MTDLQGLTFLVLTDAESRLIRETLNALTERSTFVDEPGDHPAMKAYNRGVKRGLERIKAEAGKK